MKASALLAALLLLPASVAPAGEVMSARPGRQAVPFAPGALHAAPRETWKWPVSPEPAVIRAFDPPDKPWMSGHRGVDLAAAHDGVPVTSPEAGTVSFAGLVVDRPVITIDHGNGLRSSFEPVESPLTAGAAVAKGDVIGTLLPGHCRTVACLHWGVRRGDEYVNPLEFVLDLRPSVLLPVTGAP